MRQAPKYIINSEIVGAPVDFKGRPLDHMGPIEGTALHDAVYGITHCAAVTLAAGLQEWALLRFQGMVDTAHYLALIEALLAWPIDARYYRGPKHIKVVESPPVESAMSALSDLACRLTASKYADYPGSLPPAAEVHQAFLLRHLIPRSGKRAFDRWINFVLKRLGAVAPRPSEGVGDFKDYESSEAFLVVQRPYWGVPLPIEVLDPEFDYQPAMREELLDRYLQGLDWKHNKFLRTPDEMKALGFEGTPYRLG